MPPYIRKKTMKNGGFIDCHVHFLAEHLDDFVGAFGDTGLCGCWNIVGARDQMARFIPGMEPEVVAVIDAARERAPGVVRTFYWPDWENLTDPAFPKQCAAEIAEYHRRGIAGVKVWKDMGLGLKDPAGKLMMLDDERLNPVWETMIDLRLILIAHVADPANFWLPFDETNPAYESLKRYPEWHFGKPGLPSREKLFDARNRLHRRYPDLVVVNCHFGGYAETCAQLSGWMDEMPNFHASMNPRHVKPGDPGFPALVAKHGGRLLFETDLGMKRGRKVDLAWNKEMYDRVLGMARDMFAPLGPDALGRYAHRNAERLIRDAGAAKSTAETQRR